MLDTYRKQNEVDSEWFKAAVWQTRMSGVQTMGMLAFVLGVAMRTDDSLIQVICSIMSLN